MRFDGGVVGGTEAWIKEGIDVGADVGIVGIVGSSLEGASVDGTRVFVESVGEGETMRFDWEFWFT